MLISKLVSAFFFYPLAIFFYFLFLYLASASIIPNYLYPSSPISPIIGLSKKVILSNLTFFSLFITKALHFFNPNYIPISSLSHSTVCTNESTWSSLFLNNFKASIERRWLTLNASQDHNLLLIILIPILSIINFFTFSAIPNISKPSIIQLCGIMSYAFP